MVEPAPTTEIGSPRRRDRGWFPAAAWTAMTTVLLVLQHVSNHVLRDRPYAWQWQGLHRYIDGWQQFDGHEYVRIAQEGYWYEEGVRSPIVWFPVYPMLLRAAHTIIDDPTVAGMLVSGIAGAIAVTLYWRWLAGRGMAGRAQLGALAAVMLYPYAWYLYAVVHSDSLFLALAVGAFLLVEADRKVLGGLVGALATATRPTGMALIPALIVLGMERDGILTVPHAASGLVGRFAIPIRLRLEAFRPTTLAPALCVLGLGAYMTYLGVRFGDPIAFINNQRVYHPGDLPLLKRAFFVTWRDSEDWTLPLTLTGQAIAALVTFVSVPFVGRRFGWGYALFVGTLACIPTFSTEDFMGTGRYLMAAFPTAALLGERLSQLSSRRLGTIIAAASGALLVGMSMGFARSWYLT